VTNTDRAQRLERVMARHGYSGDSLIEVLHSAQSLYGYLSPELLAYVAGKLRLPPSRVVGVATFYHLFALAPKAPHQAMVCMGTACYAAGARDLAHLFHQRFPDWQVKIGRCVGCCGLAPMVICDGKPQIRLTPDKLTHQVEEILQR
jgi:bidirectional [NiFe] hydrogenase diaphorase subunit